MSAVISKTSGPGETRQKLVTATRDLVLQQGYAGTGVDEICRQAGVTKGAFFHHFKSKEEIGKAALANWAACGMETYEEARQRPARYPLDHLHQLFAMMIRFAEESPSPVNCLVGMMSQELAQANPALRAECALHLGDWTEYVRELLEAAKENQPPLKDFDAREMAWFLNSLWQGSMLVAKTMRDSALLIQNIEQARRYLDGFFPESARSTASQKI